MPSFELQETHRASFMAKGYFMVPQLFSREEVHALQAVTTETMDDDPDRLDRHDADGNLTKLSLRNGLGDDAFSATVRCARVALTVTGLLESEVYHYHHKVMIKEPLVGGAWEWHQDYGYWYQNGCLKPDMASCLIALTAADEKNGCLELIPGSQRLGRVDHVQVNDQVCADPERVKVALARYSSELCVMAPGDAVFFHCNLIHRSLKNRSLAPRLSLINCYNTKENDPFKSHHHPSYSPLSILPDEELLSLVQKHLERLSSRGSDDA